MDNFRRWLKGFRVPTRCLGLMGLMAGWALSDASAQVVLTGADMPQPNDSYILSTTFGAIVPDVYVTGPNQTWDFANVVPTAQADLQYRAGLQSPYGANPLLWFLLFNRFGRPVADVPELVNTLLQANAGIQIEQQYEFYNNNPTANFRASARGFVVGGIPVALAYANDDIRLTFPLTDGTTGADSFVYNITVPTLPQSLSIVGHRTWQVDGWGTVVVPVGSFPCLRVSQRIQETWTITASDTVQPFVVPVIRREVIWLAPAVGHPVAFASGTEVFGFTIYNNLEIQDFDRRPLPNFAPASATLGCRPLQVAFDNQSLRSTAYLWDFGDGNTSTLANPVHTYNQVGVFSVALTGFNNLGQRLHTKQGLIHVRGPDASFTVSPNSTLEPGQTLTFLPNQLPTNPPLTYQWSFGDGTQSTDAQPQHAYGQPGHYYVGLMVEDAEGCRDTAYVGPLAVGITSLPDENNAWAFSVFPNPATRRIQFHWPAEAGSILACNFIKPNGEKFSLEPIDIGNQTFQVALPDACVSGWYALQVFGEQTYRSAGVMVVSGNQ